MKSTNFRFYNPVKLTSGDNALGSLKFELKQLQSTRPLIITDQGVLKAGLIDLLKKLFADDDRFTFITYEGVPPDSSTAVVNEAAGSFRENRCDGIIAVGGGSVIDTAKAVNMVISEGAEDIAQLEGTKLKKPMKPLIVVPTTAGTGSEVTYAAMIRDTEHNKKLLFASYQLFPDAAIFDPRMTLTLPPRIAAATAMDAMSHAMEALISNQKNEFSNAHAVAAITLIRQNLVRVIMDKNDTDGRLYLANAACMAGAAFSNSGVGIVHAMGHALGGVCGIAHGVAMNIFLPHGLEYNMDVVKDAIGNMLLPLEGPELFVKTPEDKRAERTVVCIREFQDELHKRTGLPQNLEEAGVKRGVLPEVAEKSVKDAAIHFNPKKLTAEDALGILEKAYST